MVVTERMRLWGVVLALMVVNLLLGTARLNHGVRTQDGKLRPPPPSEQGVEPGDGVAGQAGIRWAVEDFVLAEQIDAATGAALVDAMVQSESRIESIPDRIRSGALGSADAGEARLDEFDRRREDAVRLVGEDLAEELLARINPAGM